MAAYQITCISKPNRLAPDERITHVGGPHLVGAVPVEMVFYMMDHLGDTFYVLDPLGRRVQVRDIPASMFRVRHIRTDADFTGRDNLLALPDCGGNSLLGIF